MQVYLKMYEQKRRKRSVVEMFRKVSDTVWFLFERYDLREDNNKRNERIKIYFLTIITIYYSDNNFITFFHFFQFLNVPLIELIVW